MKQIINEKVLSISALVIIVLLAGWGIWQWRHNKVAPASITTTTDYHLYTEADSGSIISHIASGSVVVVQLPASEYGDPIIVTDESGKSVEFKEEIVNDSLALSFTFQQQKHINLTAHSRVSDKKDFTLTINP